MGYFLGWLIFLIFFRIYLNMKVVGRGNIPKKGPFILVSNHMSYLDPPLLGAAVYRSLNYMARDNLFKRPYSGRVMRNVHAFPVKRGKGDLSAMREALRILGAGKPLVIFPEGTRSKDKNLKSVKRGVGFIVSKAKVPVIPAYIEGTFDALPRGIMTLRRHPVRVYIGKEIDFTKGYSGADTKDQYQRLSDEVMLGIAQLKDRYAH